MRCLSSLYFVLRGLVYTSWECLFTISPTHDHITWDLVSRGIGLHDNCCYHSSSKTMQ